MGVAFEKLMYRMGLAHIKAEDQEAMKPLAVDNAHAPLAPLVKKKKGKRRRRRRRSVSPDRGETIEDGDAEAHAVPPAHRRQKVRPQAAAEVSYHGQAADDPVFDSGDVGFHARAPPLIVGLCNVIT